MRNDVQFGAEGGHLGELRDAVRPLIADNAVVMDVELRQAEMRLHHSVDVTRHQSFALAVDVDGTHQCESLIVVGALLVPTRWAPKIGRQPTCIA